MPLPLLPGEVLLVAAGLLIANGDLSPVAFFPAAYLAVLGGAVTGYTWARVLGTHGLVAAAEHLHLSKHLDRVSERLREAGVWQIAVSRLIPGLRVYTTLVAGAALVNLRVFLLGAAPAILLWEAIFTVAGILIGEPIIHLLNHVEHLAFTAAVLVVIGGAAFLAIQHMPLSERRDNALMGAPRRWRLILALVIDGGIVVNLVFGLTQLVHLFFGFFDPDGVIDVALVFAVIAVLYIATIRRSIGVTAGEAFLDISYHPFHRLPQPVPDIAECSEEESGSKHHG
ncbi:MAG: DedA family protein [Chloroflexota bacterium]|nr:DedA family protein [Chloroflexota bacterium]